MSPNSCPFVTITVHYQDRGVSMLLLLDIVKCVEVHTGVTLAVTMVKVFENFGISDKVW